MFWGSTPSLGAPKSWQIHCSEYPVVWLGGGAGSRGTRKKCLQRMQVLAIMQKYAEVCTGIKKLKVLNKLIHHLKGFMMLFEKLGQILSLGSVC